MTLTQLKTKANAKLQEFWDALVIRQEAYRLKHDKYFQLLITDPVVDGVDTTWEIRKPNDEKHAVDVDFEFNSPIPFQISVDEWLGHTKGFSITATVKLPDGRTFSRSRFYTDTRKRTRDVISGSIENGDAVYGDWYLSGADPVIETSNWIEVIEQ